MMVAYLKQSRKGALSDGCMTYLSSQPRMLACLACQHKRPSVIFQPQVRVSDRAASEPQDKDHVKRGWKGPQSAPLSFRQVTKPARYYPGSVLSVGQGKGHQVVTPPHLASPRLTSPLLCSALPCSTPLCSEHPEALDSGQSETRRHGWKTGGGGGGVSLPFGLGMMHGGGSKSASSLMTTIRLGDKTPPHWHGAGPPSLGRGNARRRSTELSDVMGGWTERAAGAARTHRWTGGSTARTRVGEWERSPATRPCRFGKVRQEPHIRTAK
ncbi:hypothetical protein K431DRAFT_52345 [Polychaeton citri CBS 116435]|uniref:Uncharacterized protein n=1 Tax=Polychaeton citri CBS 116435 TaxID=1314669 RepID=A0A9P4QEF3_9PEZI|nr:hypothetical protein K431DRAFT_52345 [Polychaeton citri CBS 116435]